MSSEDLKKLLDEVSVSGGYGRSSTSVAQFIRGLNHRGAGNIVPANTDNQGYTFFTKPNLNLSYDNVASVRRLSFMATKQETSMANAIRCLLSPRPDNSTIRNASTRKGQTFNLSDVDINKKMMPRHPFVDDKMAFITPMSNALLSISGWPDFTLESYVSKEGMRKEVTAWADSVADIYTSYDLTANFHNSDGDPITILITAWMEYQARVAEGVIEPYTYSIIEREIDYNTRIYRITLDPTRRFVRKIADTGASFPTAVGNAADFNYNSEYFQTQDKEQVSVRFQCVGARYNDPISIYSFNRTVQSFNSSMTNDNINDSMIKIPQFLKNTFNYDGYPRISEDYEFELWVPRERFQTRLAIADEYMDLIDSTIPQDQQSIIMEYIEKSHQSTLVPDYIIATDFNGIQS